MDRMAERIPGTINDITVTKNTESPLEDISVPTLIIHGTGDPVVAYTDHGRKLVEKIPGAESYIAERGEHMTSFTHNKHVRKTVKTFLHTTGLSTHFTSTALEIWRYNGKTNFGNFVSLFLNP